MNDTDERASADNAEDAAGAAARAEVTDADEELYQRAKALGEQGALARAVGAYEELLARRPGHVRARNNLGVVYDRMGRREDALAEYLRAEELDPDDVLLQCNIAAAQASLGQYREAEARLLRALQSDPKSADARENLGLVFFKKGLYPQAAEELRRATELDPERASAYFYLGEALNRMNDVDRALEALERSVELRPNARAYYTMGILCDRKGQRGLAEAMYRKAEELGGW